MMTNFYWFHYSFNILLLLYLLLTTSVSQYKLYPLLYAGAPLEGTVHCDDLFHEDPFGLNLLGCGNWDTPF